MAYLDNNGLLYLWQKIKTGFATVADLQALRDSISDMGGGDMMSATYDKDGDGIVDNAEKVNGHTVNADVPSGAKFTDTTYEAATTSKAGLQSAGDKAKLDALPTAASLESTYAKKSDITSMYKYKGSVSSESGLPTNAAVGDVYDIQTASSYGGPGMNVVWTGSKWDALGEVFTITSISNSEIDEICV